MAILCQENEWVCNPGASTHITLSDKGTKNVYDMQMLSIGHTDGAIETMALINIPWVLMIKNEDTGMLAVLKECSYNNAHSFNLLSMSRLLHKQGWKIMHGDESLICI